MLSGAVATNASHSAPKQIVRSRCGRSSPASSGVEEIVDGQQRPRTRLVEDIGCFIALEPGVERHHHAARGLRADAGEDPFGAVWCPDRDTIALCQPCAGEGARDLLRFGPQAGEGHNARAVNDRRLVAETARGGFCDGGNGHRLRFGHRLIL